jgi:hypothetical protein
LFCVGGNADSSGSLDVLAPFLEILKAPYLAGPFKLVALDALQTFMSVNLLCDISEELKNPPSTECFNLRYCQNALTSVVDAVARCDTQTN